jgi:hypothetical protein
MPPPEAATSSMTIDASVMPKPWPPYSSGVVIPSQPAGLGERVVELRGELVGGVLLQPVLVVESGRQLRYRLADDRLILGLLKVHCASPDRPPRAALIL